MAKEFFELWQTGSVLKKVFAIIGIIGFIAATLASVFSVKEHLCPKKGTEPAQAQQPASIYAENRGAGAITIGNGNTTHINIQNTHEMGSIGDEK